MFAATFKIVILTILLLLLILSAQIRLKTRIEIWQMFTPGCWRSKGFRLTDGERKKCHLLPECCVIWWRAESPLTPEQIHESLRHEQQKKDSWFNCVQDVFYWFILSSFHVWRRSALRGNLLLTDKSLMAPTSVSIWGASSHRRPPPRQHPPHLKIRQPL